MLVLGVAVLLGVLAVGRWRQGRAIGPIRTAMRPRVYYRRQGGADRGLADG